MQHPYLINPELEVPGLSEQETHQRLIEASGKLRFLETMLPKLKERGHRVLLFSQVRFDARCLIYSTYMNDVVHDRSRHYRGLHSRR